MDHCSCTHTHGLFISLSSLFKEDTTGSSCFLCVYVCVCMSENSNMCFCYSLLFQARNNIMLILNNNGAGWAKNSRLEKVNRLASENQICSSRAPVVYKSFSFDLHNTTLRYIRNKML